MHPAQPCFARLGGVHNKLDGVGPVDNRPSTDKLHKIVKKKRKKEKKVTHDMWHMTCDTWHMTHDTCHMTCWGGWAFSQNFNSLALTVCDLWYYEDIEEKADLLTHWISHEAVYRTAPATPGLLKRRKWEKLLRMFKRGCTNKLGKKQLKSFEKKKISLYFLIILHYKIKKNLIRTLHNKHLSCLIHILGNVYSRRALLYWLELIVSHIRT